LIASLAPRNLADAARLLRLVPAKANAIEFRIDMAEETLPPERLASLDPRCAILTCRTAAEGGRFTGNREEYRAIVEAAYRAGAAVDVELATDLLRDRSFLPDRRRVIGSRHGERALSVEQLGAYVATGVAAVKIAGREEALVAESLECLKEMRGSLAEGRISRFTMGVRGIPSRVLGPHFGSALTYGSVEEATGDGQLPLADLLGVYRVDDQERVEKLFAVYGGNVSRSLSPKIFNRLFARRRLPYLYVPVSASAGAESPFSSGDLEAVNALENNLFGVSVTNPFKMTALERSSPDAETTKIGAANTLVKRVAGRFALEPSNTDFLAVREALAALSVAGRRVLILGCGGAARAAAFAARRLGCEVTVAGRDYRKVKPVADAFGADSATICDLPKVEADVLINATPLGLAEDDPIPFPRVLLGRQPAVVDFVYRRSGSTNLIREAEENGCRRVEGREILARQAVGQAHFFGLPDVTLAEVREILES
jgi:3-dehydroquinate dehydratase type I